jgi:hypothetical protein
MDFLQQIDPKYVIWLTVGCSLLCVVGVILSFVMQFLGFGLEIIFLALQFVGHIITGG